MFKMLLIDYIEKRPDLLVSYLMSPTVNGSIVYQNEPIDIADDYHNILEDFSEKSANILYSCFEQAFASGQACRIAMNRVVYKLPEYKKMDFFINMYTKNKELYTFMAKSFRRFIISTSQFEQHYDMCMICETVALETESDEHFARFLHPKNTAWRYDFLLRHIENPHLHHLADDEAYEVKTPLPTLSYRLCRLALGYIEPENQDEQEFVFIAKINPKDAVEMWFNRYAVVVHEEGPLYL